jgi:hypothetical protein
MACRVAGGQQLVHGNAISLPPFDKVVPLPLVPDVTVIDTLQGNELPNALSCPNLLCDANLLLKDREVEAWDEGEGAGLIEERCCTDAALVSISRLL